MTAALAPAPALRPAGIGWELHRTPRGRATAIGYWGGHETIRLTGPLLRLRIAWWTRHLTACATR